MGRRRNLADLSPQPVYWDPRYERYFYAGTLPPLDAAVSPKVEVEPIKPTRRPSILVTGGDQASEREERQERHISWSLLDEDDEAPAEDDQRGANVAPAWRPVASAMNVLVGLSLLSLLAVFATLWATGSLDYAGRAAQTARQDVTATTTIFPTAAPESSAESSVRDRAEFETGAPAPAGSVKKRAGNADVSTTTLTNDAEAYVGTKANTTGSHGRRRTRSSRRQTFGTTRTTSTSTRQKRRLRRDKISITPSSQPSTVRRDLRRRRRRPKEVSSNTRHHN
ncbi:hypothetical protein HPB50_020337 [Hyalomma asiaticum]|uniref:Uncharacterized protein n=1 Tax=Hyalomma asiaticum TaxID=266040 RepID=A0ACB7TNF1_HYAAI|nr:hypothetical protein HPB50_020337 [Hyalomma asiaticum]